MVIFNSYVKLPEGKFFSKWVYFGGQERKTTLLTWFRSRHWAASCGQAGHHGRIGRSRWWWNSLAPQASVCHALSLPE